MSKLLNTCPNLQADCDRLLQLLNAQPKLRSFDITPVQPSLRKAVSPTLEIVFAGPFSAGKSMLISDISRYLGEEKYPQLLEQLVSDLQNVCINLSNL
ncbi:MAG TPA: hypothetical protein IGQ15_04310 [Thermosynechococcus sp. M98_K2018_005]|uniref:hypothetical protein n=1 Tax=Thermosynechococcus sp. M98_K2018_005 TaxID=2747811 RepID=UPI0019F90399|nr:hypothetical protein [Thermosynechococcus sp. M98_K2018_005]HIK34910.1 hypothetical protein [Thermosynechococcus sp. M98_K2018_005]